MKSKRNGLFWLLALSFVIGLASLYARTSSGPIYEEQCTDPSAQELERVQKINDAISSPLGGEFKAKPKCRQVRIQ